MAILMWNIGKNTILLFSVVLRLNHLLITPIYILRPVATKHAI